MNVPLTYAMITFDTFDMCIIALCICVSYAVAFQLPTCSCSVALPILGQERGSIVTNFKRCSNAWLPVYFCGLSYNRVVT